MGQSLAISIWNYTLTTWIFKAGRCAASSFLVKCRNRQKKGMVWGLGGMGQGMKPPTHNFFLPIPIPYQKAGSCALPALKIQVVHSSCCPWGALSVHWEPSTICWVSLPTIFLLRFISFCTEDGIIGNIYRFWLWLANVIYRQMQRSDIVSICVNGVKTPVVSHHSCFYLLTSVTHVGACMSDICNTCRSLYVWHL